MTHPVVHPLSSTYVCRSTGRALRLVTHSLTVDLVPEGRAFRVSPLPPGTLLYDRGPKICQASSTALSQIAAFRRRLLEPPDCFIPKAPLVPLEASSAATVRGAYTLNDVRSFAESIRGTVLKLQAAVRQVLTAPGDASSLTVCVFRETNPSARFVKGCFQMYHACRMGNVEAGPMLAAMMDSAGVIQLPASFIDRLVSLKPAAPLVVGLLIALTLSDCV